jgi:hypothetical protein
MDDLHIGMASAVGRPTIADHANFATGGASILVVEEDSGA